MVILAVDKDVTGADDDLLNRIPAQAPLYKVEQAKPVYEYYLEMENAETEEIIQPDVTTDLMLGEEMNLNVHLMLNEEKVLGAHNFEYTAKLGGIKQENWGKYFSCEFDSETGELIIKNLKQCNRGVVGIEIKCVDADLAEPVVQNYTFKLGGFY